MSDSRPLDSIIVEGRHRKDVGDLTELAESIETIGLLHPIVITPSNRLVAGQRRVEACRRLGWEEIPVTVVESLTEAAELTQAEADENTCRMDMKPSEKVALGLVLETLERPKAKARQIASQAKPGEQIGAGKLPGPTDGDLREIVGAAVGMSGSSYDRAKSVVKAVRDEDLSQEVRDLAVTALKKMDDSGKVKTKEYKNFMEVFSPARNGKPKPKPKTKTYRGRPAKEAIEGAIHVLCGLVTGFESFTVEECSPSGEEAARWEDDLKESVSIINQFRRQMKEYRNGYKGDPTSGDAIDRVGLHRPDGHRP